MKTTFLFRKKTSLNKEKLILLFIMGIFLISCFTLISASRLPTVDGDSGTWGTILNTFLNVSHNESGALRNNTVSTAQITDGTIIDSDISDTTNLTLGEKITFTLGEIIDNLVDSWIRITGNLNVTANATIGENLNVNGNITVLGNISADYYYGNGSQLHSVNVSDEYAKYQFTNNNFNGSGNFTTTGRFLASNSKVSAPSYTFTDEPTLGLYRYGAGRWALAASSKVSIRGDQYGVLVADGSAAFPSYSFDNSGFMGFFRASNNVMGISTAGIERVRIGATGNVGIGTTSPASKLEVNGSLNIVNNTDTAFFVNQTLGRVGIGTATPSATLEINQSADSKGIKLRGFDDISTHYGNIYVTNGGTVWIVAGKDSGDINSLYLDATDWIVFNRRAQFRGSLTMLDDQKYQFGTGQDISLLWNDANSLFRLMNEDTDKPIMEFDLDHNVSFSSVAQSGQTPELKLYGYRGGDAKRSLEIGVGVDASDTASFDGVSNYYFDGNVSIGTTTPTHKLNVVGDVNITGNLILNNTIGMTGNYSVGNCWIDFVQGIAKSTNCTAN